MRKQPSGFEFVVRTLLATALFIVSFILVKQLLHWQIEDAEKEFYGIASGAIALSITYSVMKKLV